MAFLCAMEDIFLTELRYRPLGMGVYAEKVVCSAPEFPCFTDKKCLKGHIEIKRC